MKAIEKMQKATSDEDVRAILEYREKAVRDGADRMAYATKKALMRGKEEGIMIGKEEGIMIGKEEGMMIGKEEGMMIGKEEGIMIGEQKGKELERINIAIQMLSHTISIDTISAVTGLSKEDILKLKQ